MVRLVARLANCSLQGPGTTLLQFIGAMRSHEPLDSQAMLQTFVLTKEVVQGMPMQNTTPLPWGLQSDSFEFHDSFVKSVIFVFAITAASSVLLALNFNGRVLTRNSTPPHIKSDQG